LSGYTISMSGPDVTEAEIKAVEAVLRTPHLSIGPRIAEFEERFAAYVGARHAIGVSNGTAGLHLCVIAAGVGEGDPSGLSPSGRSLVITTPFSFVPSTKLRTSASANVILYERAIPVFVDIDPKTLNIDPTLTAEAVYDLTQGGHSAQHWLPPSLRNPKSKIQNPKSKIGTPRTCVWAAGRHGRDQRRGARIRPDHHRRRLRSPWRRIQSPPHRHAISNIQYPIPNTQYPIRNTQQSSPFTLISR